MTDTTPDAAAVPEAEAPSPQQGAQTLDELRERLIDQLNRELGDSYDCTRVWEAWNVGTMGQDDFEPVTERVDDIADGILERLALPSLLDRAEAAERAEAERDESFNAAVGAHARAEAAIAARQAAEARADALAEALKPFAEVGRHIRGNRVQYTIRPDGEDVSLPLVSARDFRKAFEAAQALSPSTTGEGE